MSSNDDKTEVSLDALRESTDSWTSRAQHFDNEGNDKRIEAWRTVSSIEEQIAEHPDTQDYERILAKRWTIEAAEKAGETERAANLRAQWNM